MKVFSVHEPPRTKEAATTDIVKASEDIAFVRDGFSVLALLLPLVWLLWHRLWFWAAAYFGCVLLIEGGIALAGLPRETGSVMVLLNLLVGLEGNNLRRRALERRGWTEIGIASGATFAECETRFFADWVERQQSELNARQRRLSAMLEQAGTGGPTSVPVTAGAFFHSKGGHA